MIITATLNTQEIKEAIARDYGVRAKDVALVYNNFNTHTAIIENIDLSKNDLKGDTSPEKDEDEVSIIKERINTAMEEIIKERMEQGCCNKDETEGIAEGMAIALKIFADTLGIEIIEF